MLKHTAYNRHRKCSLITVQDNTMLKRDMKNLYCVVSLITVQDNTMLKQKISTNPNMSV